MIALSPVEPALDFDLSWLALGRFGFSEMSPEARVWFWIALSCDSDVGVCMGKCLYTLIC